ncbi:PPC domain-containing protein [Polyangium mundeleinium]|uniref:PPC domain-containing protein n=1 Tax=Polyangium mundeleinium TaxID=2995306 RepID=A0ABT5EWI5_9BACT|nr:PPC domain-containing protein [Polyangium mundeleinium]MDC0746179.1 PPC domain-containing protein [Polyangium mundeleinium]
MNRAALPIVLACVAGCGGGGGSLPPHAWATRPAPPPATQGERTNTGSSDAEDDDKSAWRPGRFMTQAVGLVTGAAQRFERQSRFGFDEDASCVLGAFLENGREVSVTRPLRAGVRYVILGGGSDGVEDLDLAVESPEGKVIAADTMDDAQPVVELTPPVDGKYRIRLANARKGEGGGFGVVAIMREGGQSISVRRFVDSFGQTLSNAARASHLVARKMEGSQGLAFHADGEWSFFGTILAEEEGIQTGGLELEAPLSVVLAGADGRTDDINLEVLDVTTNEIAGRDEAEDASPVVALKPTKGHTYKVSVTNVKGRGPSLVAMLILDLDVP